jgi:glutamate 5-kinase
MDIAGQNSTSASMSPNGAAALRYKRVVVKAGTSVLTGGSDMLHLPTVSGLVDQIATIHSLGAEVMLVTSGAIAAGRKPLGVKGDLPNVNFRQVLAAVGQNRLMHTYSLLFEPKGINIAQVLLTWDDLADVEHSRNVRRTLDSLLELRVVPVMNENDVVAVEEIGEVFGDNDMLSAMVAKLVQADLLVILTDADGLMTADPRTDSKARRIPRVDNIDGHVESLAGKKLNPWSRGGMKTKVEAARLATSSGVTVVVCDGRRPNVVGRIEAGEDVGTLFAAAKV